jgi:hypothetical protein
MMLFPFILHVILHRRLMKTKTYWTTAMQLNRIIQSMLLWTSTRQPLDQFYWVRTEIRHSVPHHHCRCLRYLIYCHLHIKDREQLAGSHHLTSQISFHLFLRRSTVHTHLSLFLRPSQTNSSCHLSKLWMLR